MEPTTLDSIGGIRLYQHREGYRFSLDSVLLASFVKPPPSAVETADLGAGAGVVGLLLAARYGRLKVTLMELQEGLCSLAERNVKLNGFGTRVEARRLDLRDLPDELYGGFDLAVSNPPFREPGSGKLSRGRERALARHELELTLPELIRASAQLLKARGRFYLVHHPGRLGRLITAMRDRSLEPKSLRFVHGTERAEAKMVLVEAVMGAREGLKVQEPLYVYGGDGEYTPEVARMFA